MLENWFPMWSPRGLFDIDYWNQNKTKRNFFADGLARLILGWFCFGQTGPDRHFYLHGVFTINDKVSNLAITKYNFLFSKFISYDISTFNLGQWLHIPTYVKYIYIHVNVKWASLESPGKGSCFWIN